MFQSLFKNRRASAFDELDFQSFDPFQIFEITHQRCHVLRISNLHGQQITKGWAKDLLDTPDPYLVFQVKNTPNGRKKTSHINNEINPKWEETFDFYLDSLKFVLEVSLKDANYTIDETLGVEEYDLSDLKLNQEKEATLVYPNGSKVFFTLLLLDDPSPHLRYSLALCDEEKAFLQERKKKVFAAMRKLLGDRGPQTEKEVPVIGLLGSGGGFRAMVCLSGVFKALSESGLLDCATYVCGLSGSSWYISTLYSHPEFPSKPVTEIQEELRDDINHTPLRFINPKSLFIYMGEIISKHLQGQHISFTDFFGHLLGDTLLRNRKESRLSDQRQKVNDGSVPMPLYTCLHVKKNVTAKVYQEWLEFSPYEIGIAKYGTFMKSDVFGSKLYLGRIVKRYPEFPLHYLQGVWGSAFCILFKQLARENGRKDLAQMIRENDKNYDETELDQQLADFKVTDEDDQSESSGDEDHVVDSLIKPSENQDGPKPQKPRRLSEETRRKTQMSLWQGMVTNIFNSSWLDTCAGRAAMVYNPLRGLQLRYLYPISPFSPTTPSDDVDFKGNNEAIPTDVKKLYLVDSGLTFNSPYPILLRPQRAVDVYLSFDFSARPTDDTPPFKELLLAEKWAKYNHVNFPPIKEQVSVYAKERKIRECYLFKHPNDPFCPVILHFVITNNKFRDFKAPGVKRETEEEFEEADFDIFDDPDNPYSLYNFNYPPELFDRLSKLMEFNTLDSVQLISDVIANAVERKRQYQPQPVITLADIAKIKLKFRTKDAFSRLKAYVRSFSKDEMVPREKELAKTENGMNDLSLNSESETPND